MVSRLKDLLGKWTMEIDGTVKTTEANQAEVSDKSFYEEEAMEVDATGVLFGQSAAEKPSFVDDKPNVPMEYHQIVALWSCDNSVGAIEVIPALSKYSQIFDLYDKWSKRRKEWIGSLVFFHTVNDAYEMTSTIPNMMVGGRWPLKALNMGMLLQFISDTEHALEASLRDEPTIVSIDNMPSDTPISIVRSLCEDFGTVVSVEQLEIGKDAVDKLLRGGVTTRFLVGFAKCSEAYAACTMLDCRKEFDAKLGLKILNTKKSQLIYKETSRNDLLLWNRD